MNMLQRRIAATRTKEEGFTLVELLIVIVILGILAAVVVFSVGGVTDKGSKSACEASRSAVITGAEAAYAQTGAYPASLTELIKQKYLNAGGATVTDSEITGKGWSITYSTDGTSVTVSDCPK